MLLFIFFSFLFLPCLTSNPHTVNEFPKTFVMGENSTHFINLAQYFAGDRISFQISNKTDSGAAINFQVFNNVINIFNGSSPAPLTTILHIKHLSPEPEFVAIGSNLVMYGALCNFGGKIVFFQTQKNLKDIDPGLSACADLNPLRLSSILDDIFIFACSSQEGNYSLILSGSFNSSKDEQFLIYNRTQLPFKEKNSETGEKCLQKFQFLLRGDSNIFIAFCQNDTSFDVYKFNDYLGAFEFEGSVFFMQYKGKSSIHFTNFSFVGSTTCAGYLFLLDQYQGIFQIDLSMPIYPSPSVIYTINDKLTDDSPYVYITCLDLSINHPSQNLFNLLVSTEKYITSMDFIAMEFLTFSGKMKLNSLRVEKLLELQNFFVIVAEETAGSLGQIERKPEGDSLYSITVISRDTYYSIEKNYFNFKPSVFLLGSPFPLNVILISEEPQAKLQSKSSFEINNLFPKNDPKPQYDPLNLGQPSPNTNPLNIPGTDFMLGNQETVISAFLMTDPYLKIMASSFDSASLVSNKTECFPGIRDCYVMGFDINFQFEEDNKWKSLTEEFDIMFLAANQSNIIPVQREAFESDLKEEFLNGFLDPMVVGPGVSLDLSPFYYENFVQNEFLITQEQDLFLTNIPFEQNSELVGSFFYDYEYEMSQVYSEVAILIQESNTNIVSFSLCNVNYNDFDADSIDCPIILTHKFKKVIQSEAAFLQETETNFLEEDYMIFLLVTSDSAVEKMEEKGEPFDHTANFSQNKKPENKKNQRNGEKSSEKNQTSTLTGIYVTSGENQEIRAYYIENPIQTSFNFDKMFHIPYTNFIFLLEKSNPMVIGIYEIGRIEEIDQKIDSARLIINLIDLVTLDLPALIDSNEKLVDVKINSKSGFLILVSNYRMFFYKYIWIYRTMNFQLVLSLDPKDSEECAPSQNDLQFLVFEQNYILLDTQTGTVCQYSLDSIFLSMEKNTSQWLPNRKVPLFGMKLNCDLDSCLSLSNMMLLSFDNNFAFIDIHANSNSMISRLFSKEKVDEIYPVHFHGKTNFFSASMILIHDQVQQTFKIKCFFRKPYFVGEFGISRFIGSEILGNDSKYFNFTETISLKASSPFQNNSVAIPIEYNIQIHDLKIVTLTDEVSVYPVEDVLERSSHQIKEQFFMGPVQFYNLKCQILPNDKYYNLGSVPNSDNEDSVFTYEQVRYDDCDGNQLLSFASYGELNSHFVRDDATKNKTGDFLDIQSITYGYFLTLSTTSLAVFCKSCGMVMLANYQLPSEAGDFQGCSEILDVISKSSVESTNHSESAGFDQKLEGSIGEESLNGPSPDNMVFIVSLLCLNKTDEYYLTLADLNLSLISTTLQKPTPFDIQIKSFARIPFDKGFINASQIVQKGSILASINFHVYSNLQESVMNIVYLDLVNKKIAWWTTKDSSFFNSSSLKSFSLDLYKLMQTDDNDFRKYLIAFTDRSKVCLVQIDFSGLSFKNITLERTFCTSSIELVNPDFGEEIYYVQILSADNWQYVKLIVDLNTCSREIEIYKFQDLNLLHTYRNIYGCFSNSLPFPSQKHQNFFVRPCLLNNINVIQKKGLDDATKLVSLMLFVDNQNTKEKDVSCIQTVANFEPETAKYSKFLFFDVESSQCTATIFLVGSPVYFLSSFYLREWLTVSFRESEFIRTNMESTFNLLISAHNAYNYKYHIIQLKSKNRNLWILLVKIFGGLFITCCPLTCGLIFICQAWRAKNQRSKNQRKKNEFDFEFSKNINTFDQEKMIKLQEIFE